MAITRQRRSELLRNIHGYATEFFRVIDSLNQMREPINLENILDNSDPLYRLYASIKEAHAPRVVILEDCVNSDDASPLSNEEIVIRELFNKYLKQTLICIKFSNIAEFENFINTITKPGVMSKVQLSKILLTISDHAYPTEGLTDLIPDADVRDLHDSLHALDLCCSLPDVVIAKHREIYQLRGSIRQMAVNLEQRPAPEKRNTSNIPCFFVTPRDNSNNREPIALNRLSEYTNKCLEINKKSHNPLLASIASRQSFDEIARIIRANPKLVSSVDIDENTPLHLVAMSNHPDSEKLIAMLMEYGAVLLAKNIYDLGPSHCAAATGAHNALKVLLDYAQGLNNCSVRMHQ